MELPLGHLAGMLNDMSIGQSRFFKCRDLLDVRLPPMSVGTMAELGERLVGARTGAWGLKVYPLQDEIVFTRGKDGDFPPWPQEGRFDFITGRWS